MRKRKDIKYVATICGHFGGNKNFYDGQTVKTQTIATCLKDEFGAKNITCVDTYGGIKRAPLYISQLIDRFICSNNIIILPAQNGIKLLAPLLVLINRLFHKKIHYIVIGGWLPELLDKDIRLSSCLKKFDFIYVETSIMKNRLEDKGFNNIVLLTNFKDLEILNENELIYEHQEPYSLCTFSRVMEKKGIEDIIVAVDLVNRKLNRIAYKLDIYGQIDVPYENQFQLLMEQNKDFVTYKGVVAPNKSVYILREYFFLAFPTKFFTEGIPGTIIDAYAAGVPVVSSKWESFADLVEDGLSGIGYSMGNIDELVSILVKIAKKPELILNMKKYCLQKAKLYTPEIILAILKEKL